MSSYKRSRRALARRRKQKLKNILAASACLLIVLGCGCFWALNALTPAARPARPQVEEAAPPMTQARTASQGPQTADRVMATEAPTPAPRRRQPSRRRSPRSPRPRWSRCRSW